LRAITKRKSNRDKRCGDFVHHAISEVILIGIAAHILERQYRYGGFIGQRECWPRRFYRVVGGCRACGPLRFLHLSDETKALARQCLDQALFLTGIADRTADGIQACRKRRIGNDAAVPNGVDEVVLANDALSVVDQVIEQVEYLWRDRDDVRPAIYLASIGVECVLLEKIAQAANPSGGHQS
jgi:hypothetical protein